MIDVYADVQGKVLRRLDNDQHRQRYGKPATYAHELHFDADTNASALQLLRQDEDNCRIQNGVLRHRGQVVAVNAPGPTTSDESTVAALVPRLRDGLPLTPSELAAILRLLLRRGGLTVDA